MTERYTLQRATEDLRQARLLREVVVAEAGAWRQVDAPPAAAAFHGAVLDSREARAGVLFVGLPGPRTDGGRFAATALAQGAHALIGPASCQGGIPTGPAPERGVILVSEQPEAALARLASCWRDRFELPVVGITGSNGKTTTKDLLAALLAGVGPTLATAGNYNNELGVPLTLLALRPEHGYAVVEMGASAQGDIAALARLAAPQIGVITNAAEAHLAAFGSLDGVIAGKGELLDALPADGVAILNHDSPGFASWRRRAVCRVVSFGRSGGDHRWQWQPRPDGGLLHLDGEDWPVPLPGLHNGGNLTAAILAARAAGATRRQMRAGLAGFRPSPHRSRLLRLGERFVLDDSYNANPESVRSVAATLLALAGGRTVALLGGMAELGPRSEDIHRETGRQLHAEGIDVLVAVGEAADPLASGFADAGGRAERCIDAAAAVAWVDEHTGAGDHILVKGSRSTAMDEVVKLLEIRWGRSGASE
jgi:UDP-N-acetylmuramoyl-tripeptide--D-alanyl-D-alanine ligase